MSLDEWIAVFPEVSLAVALTVFSLLLIKEKYIR